MTLFRPESLDHKRRKLHGEVILVQPVSFYVMTAVLLIATAILVSFLAGGQYKRKETVPGYLSPQGGVAMIRADQGGRLTQVFVSEGDYVQVGSPLFSSRVDVDTDAGLVGARRLESTDVRLSELQQQIMEIETRYKQEEARLKSQIENYELDLSGIERRLILQREAVSLSSTQLAKYERLTVDNVTSVLELDQAKSNDINQRLNLESLEQQSIARKGALSEVRFALDALPNTKLRELSQLRVQISQLEDSRAALEASTDYMVRSPIAGTVTALQAKVGQSTNPAAPIVMITPEGSPLIATLLAPSRAAGFLEAGQDVNLLVDAFPYQKFGVQKGVITEVSATPYRPGELDAPIVFEQSVYRVIVALDKSTVSAYGNEVALKSGMTLQGDLVIDRRTLLQWMLDPLFTLKRS